MPLSALTNRAAVLQAMAEFDEIGRDAFLAKYGYGPARSYFVLQDGRHYDSKAIAGAAHGYEHPSRGPLTASEFSGGEATVRAKLKELGFAVVRHGESRPAEYGSVWAEITSLEHGHGGPGWDLGQWLWSPTASRDGADRYSIMQTPLAGDRVFHLVSGLPGEPVGRRFLYGVSSVAQSAVRTTERPTAPGAWGEAEAYFKVLLADFAELAPKVPMDQLEAGLADLILTDLENRPKYYPYAPYRDGFRGAQGIYLTLLTKNLAEAFEQLSGAGSSARDSGRPRANVGQAAQEFAEGQRTVRESAFFRRNPALRAAAIRLHGTRCSACGFDFLETYGDLGEGYIEVHHLNPLAERRDALSETVQMTSVDDLTPLCANCHRMAHRRYPAVPVDEIRSSLVRKRAAS